MLAERVASARQALEAGDAGTALDLLDLAEIDPVADGDGDVGVAAEVLELRALALYADGRYEASIATWEELHRLQLAADDPREAGRVAATIALYLMIDSGLMAAVRGWLARAGHLVVDHPDAPAHALIALVRTYERLMTGDMAGTRAQATRAIELGEALGVAAAVVIGRVALARVRILEGEVTEGVAELDEVAVLLMSGAVDPLTAGMMYCELVCAAQGLALHDRAREWTEMMDHWRPGNATGGINGRCRVHRAEMLRLSGPCDEAEAEAIAACEELRPWMRREFGWPLVELGNIRLRKGDLEGAEAAYLEAHRHVWTPHPGLALVRLEEGEVDVAAALVAEAIAHPFDAPSKERPPFGDLRLAPLLEAQVEIAAAAGDADLARRAADRLAEIAESYPSVGLGAAALLAEARAALCAGAVEEAVVASSAAVVTWAELEAPFELGVARLVLGHAQTAAGHPDSARGEWEAARCGFEEFGAERWARRAAALLGQDRPPVSHGRAESVATASFRRSGDSRIIAHDGSEVVVRDLKGFRHLERLLCEPGREFHALDLVVADEGIVADAPDDAVVGEELADLGSGGLLILDDQAREAYRRRLAEVDDDIADAERMNDLGRAELARRDRDYLVSELSRAVGLGGRSRVEGDRSERARMAVTRSIRYSLRRLAEHHPSLAEHLSRCVRTGTYCCYAADPLNPVEWEL